MYFESQMHQILNLDETKVSTDGTIKLTGGRSSTKIPSADKSLPQGWKYYGIGMSNILSQSSNIFGTYREPKINGDWFKNSRSIQESTV